MEAALAKERGIRSNPCGPATSWISAKFRPANSSTWARAWGGVSSPFGVEWLEAGPEGGDGSAPQPQGERPCEALATWEALT